MISQNGGWRMVEYLSGFLIYLGRLNTYNHVRKDFHFFKKPNWTLKFGGGVILLNYAQ